MAIGDRAGRGRARSPSRIRPGDPAWPLLAEWQQLSKDVGGRLFKVRSPLAVCIEAPSGAACAEIFKELKNPYYLGDEVGLTQSLGWVGAWTSRPSVYAVAVETTADIVAAVNFAREHNLRLVVKGGGHSYFGGSNAGDSLLIWTRKMNAVAVHDAFVGAGCAGRVEPAPAVTVEAGAIWRQVYGEVTTKAGRYVQGGGCLTVGVAGLISGGGFGSFSKRYGMAAASLLEAEIVTADGDVKIANPCTNPDLFWAIKGGGGGFGVVTRMTLRTHELPEFFGGVFLAIKAKSDDAHRRLIGRIVEFYAEALFNPHWGEQLVFGPGRARYLDGVPRARRARGRDDLASLLQLGRRLAWGFRCHRGGESTAGAGAVFLGPGSCSNSFPASCFPTTARARRRTMFSGPAISERQAFSGTAINRPGCPPRC